MYHLLKTCFLAICIFRPLHGSLGTILSLSEGKNTVQQNSFVASINKQIEALKVELTKIKDHNTVADRLARVDQSISDLKDKIKSTQSFSERSLLSKILAVFTGQVRPLLIDLGQAYEQFEIFLAKNIKHRKEYGDDPLFLSLRLPKKSYYTFEDLQSLEELVISSEGKLTASEEKKAAIEADFVHKRRNLDDVRTNYDLKKREQENFAHKVLQRHRSALVNARLDGELLDAQAQALAIKKELLELRVNEAENRLSYLDFQMLVLNNKLEVLKNELSLVNRSIRVDDHYVAQQQVQLERKRAAELSLKNHYYNQIRVYRGLREDGQRQLALTLEQLGLTQNDIVDLQDWKQNFSTIQQWVAGAKVGNILVAQSELEVHKDYIEGQIEIGKNKLLDEELNFEIIRSWNKMTMHKFALDADREVNTEVNQYEQEKNEFQSTISSLAEKKASVANAISTLNHSLLNIQAKIKELASQKNKLFKEHSAEYTQVVSLLQNAQEHMSSQIELLNKLLEMYTQLHYKILNQIKKIELVIHKLKEKSWWIQVSEIRWEQVGSFVPQVALFLTQYVSLAHDFIIKKYEHIRDLSVKDFFYICTLLLFLLFSFYAVRWLLIYVGRLFIQKPSRAPFLLIDFFVRSIGVLWIWGALYLCILLGFYSSVVVPITFYFISIPLLCYWGQRLITFFFMLNSQEKYIILSAEYEKRLRRVIVLVLNASIGILFFRQAFLAMEYSSDVPLILLAVHFCILQVALISLISKKHILSIISTDTPLWEWIEENVNRFYYFLFAGVLVAIVLSNPYLGYGRLLLPVLLRIMFSLGCIPLFSWLYRTVRAASLDLFFTSDDDTIQERFSYSKTWHGFFVIVMLFVFMFLGFLVLAKVWSYPFTFKTLSQILRYEISVIDYDAVTGRPISLTILSLLKTILFVVVSIVISFVVNRFILQRIFDPGLIGVGLQSTLLTLSRYLIVLMGLLIGLNNVGLSSIVVRFFLILVALGFALKEPLSDFFCYFILLVQRPIKIGDFIMLNVGNEEITGVVRHITPRSVIIRKKNSTTILVPNSHFITNSIINWSYTKNFLAFNDILLTISYDSDPVLAKELIYKTLINNSNILKNPAPVIMLSNFAENGYEFTIRGYISADKVLDQFVIASDVRFDLVAELAKNKIEIARPIRLVKTV